MRLPPTPCRVYFRPCVFNKFSHFWQKIGDISLVFAQWVERTQSGHINPATPVERGARPAGRPAGVFYNR